MNDNREKLDMFLEDERLDPLYQDLVPDAPDFVETSVRRIKAMKRTRTRRLISSIGGIAAVLLVFAALRTAPLLFGGSKKSAMKDETAPAVNYEVSVDDTVKEPAPEPESAEAEGIDSKEIKAYTAEPDAFFPTSEQNGSKEQEEIEEVYLFEEDDWKELYDLLITDHRADNIVGYMEMEDGIKLKNFLSGKEKLLEMVRSESLRDILGMIEHDRVIIYFK